MYLLVSFSRMIHIKIISIPAVLFVTILPPMPYEISDHPPNLYELSSFKQGQEGWSRNLGVSLGPGPNPPRWVWVRTTICT